MIIKSDNPNSDDIDYISPLIEEGEQLIQLKIVYWGPGESGKTTNFKRLREKFHTIKLTNGYSIETTDGRTLWSDSMFLALKIPMKDNTISVIVQITTCTGQERFLSTREYIIDGADGIVFIGDSDPEKLEQNKRSYRELISFATSRNIPYVVQLNKRDLEEVIPVPNFKKQLGLPPFEKYPDGNFVVYPATATKGNNVVRCFWDIVFQAVIKYFT